MSHPYFSTLEVLTFMIVDSLTVLALQMLQLYQTCAYIGIAHPVCVIWKATVIFVVGGQKGGGGSSELP